MIAILGRGIQRLSETAPVEDVRSWVLTEDLELCDKDSAHLPVRVPVDDESPFCMIGGGEMNLLAGMILAQESDVAVLKAIVCAYGGRSGYLESIGAPSESEVMSEILRMKLHGADEATSPMHYETYPPNKYPDEYTFTKIVVWERNRQLPVPSNTRQELLNIFDLALERGLRRIGLVTVGVHIPRTATYIAKHLSVYPKYRELTPILLESEEVLLADNREKDMSRVEAMRSSKSFARNWARESIGISKIVRDVYGDAKPAVIVQGSGRDSSKEPLGANAS